MKVDWLFNDNASRSCRKIAIELKCESFDNRTNFGKGIDDDLNKLNKQNLKPEYERIQRAVVGIYFEEKARKHLIQRDFINLYENTEISYLIKGL